MVLIALHLLHYIDQNMLMSSINMMSGSYIFVWKLKGLFEYNDLSGGATVLCRSEAKSVRIQLCNQWLSYYHQAKIFFFFLFLIDLWEWKTLKKLLFKLRYWHREIACIELGVFLFLRLWKWADCRIGMDKFRKHTTEHKKKKKHPPF